MILAEGILSDEVLPVLTLIVKWLSPYWWVLLIIAGAYLFVTCWYWRRSIEAADKIYIAPISVKGSISKELGSREVGLLLRTHLDSIAETFRKATSSQASAFAAEAVTVYFPSLNKALVDAPLKLDRSKLNVKEELVVTIGPVQIPVGAIINLFVALLRVLPVPFKKRYLASLINVSLVSVVDETQLLVYRKWQRPLPRGNSQPETMDQSESGPVLLTKTTGTKNLTSFADMLRDAAFMILQLHGKFEGRNWLGMRCFADGLDALDEYRQTTKDELLNTAKESFACAVAADENNYEAIYFYGSMLLFERTRGSVAMATRLFLRALENKKLKLELRALVNAGLAHCYAQQFHRLAKRGADVLAKIHSHAEQARQQWKEATDPDTEDTDILHPWILYTLALSGIAGEGSGCNLEEFKNRFLASKDQLLKAIEMEPDNGMFYNTLGWLFLKLAQRERKNPEDKEGFSPKMAENFAKKAEHYIRLALDLNPENKRSHANLCLLYATPLYRAKQEEYLVRCRYHGLKAIQIDPEYINGHRDLALSLIQYGEFGEAKKHFEDALHFAAVVDKDMEIIKDTVETLKNVGAGEEVVKRFRHPKPQLLEPPNPTEIRDNTMMQ
jgi:tetratricopeptide (TPR) repeat protein